MAVPTETVLPGQTVGQPEETTVQTVPVPEQALVLVPEQEQEQADKRSVGISILSNGEQMPDREKGIVVSYYGSPFCA